MKPMAVAILLSPLAPRRGPPFIVPDFAFSNAQLRA